MSKEFDAVVFDMDGVIFDSERCVIECWKVVAEEYHIPDIETSCYACMGLTREATKQEMLRRYGQDFPYDDYKKKMSAVFDERYGEGRLPVKPGTRELLGALREAGKKIALASSTRLKVVQKELAAAGLLDYFDILVCGDMVEKSKPAPDIFLKACELLHVSPEKSVAIEDSYNGIRSASAAHLITIMVPDLALPTDEMRTLSAAILPSLLDVRTYLL